MPIEIPTKRVKIEGVEYAIRLLPADQGLEPLGRLLVMVGRPAVRALLSGDSVKGLVAAAGDPSKQVDEAMLESIAKHIGEALDGLLAEFKPSDLAYFAGVFKPHTEVCDNNMSVPLTDVFDQHFAGRYGALRGWLLFCLRENFASFLGGTGLPGRAAAAARRAVSEAASSSYRSRNP